MHVKWISLFWNLRNIGPEGHHHLAVLCMDPGK